MLGGWLPLIADNKKFWQFIYWQESFLKYIYLSLYLWSNFIWYWRIFCTQLLQCYTAVLGICLVLSECTKHFTCITRDAYSNPKRKIFHMCNWSQESMVCIKKPSEFIAEVDLSWRCSGSQTGLLAAGLQKLCLVICYLSHLLFPLVLIGQLDFWPALISIPQKINCLIEETSVWAKLPKLCYPCVLSSESNTCFLQVLINVSCYCHKKLIIPGCSRFLE